MNAMHDIDLTAMIGLPAALKQSQVPLAPASIRRLLSAGVIAGARVGGRWKTTPEAIRAALVKQVGPQAKP